MKSVPSAYRSALCSPGTFVQASPPQGKNLTPEAIYINPSTALWLSGAAVLTLARTEGVLLDPVYTAKGFASLLAAAPRMDPEHDVVFVHTGGQPGLFAYADAFA